METVETSAGLGSGSLDEEYVRAGAKIMSTGPEVFAEAQMIVKVKEPLAEERKRLKRGQILFTYLHLAPDLEQTRDLMASGATCIAYETVTSSYGGLPLLTCREEADAEEANTGSTKTRCAGGVSARARSTSRP